MYDEELYCSVLHKICIFLHAGPGTKIQWSRILMWWVTLGGGNAIRVLKRNFLEVHGPDNNISNCLDEKGE